MLASLELSVSAAPPQILPAETVEHPDLRALLDYWNRLRRPNPMPARPVAGRQIGGLLKRLHLSDVVDDGADFRFRLLGDAVFVCSAENQTGRLVSTHPDIGVRLRYPILMREVVRTRGPVRGLAVRVTSNTHFRTDSLWLPFGGPDVQQVMGMSVLTQIDADETR